MVTQIVTLLYSLALCLLTYGEENPSGSIPCAARDYGHMKIVCVCNSTYCDTIQAIRDIKKGTFVMVLSTQEGLRFKVSSGNIDSSVRSSSRFKMFKKSPLDFTVNPNKKYQTIIGFGGAFTDSSGINIYSLEEDLQLKLMSSYYSIDGIEYNCGRVPIGGTDFSTRTYSYDDGATDLLLNNFELAEEDFKYKIPLLQLAKKLSPSEVYLMAACWSPPPWMKGNHGYDGRTHLIYDYCHVYAKYLIRFLDEYKKHNLTMWALSSGNEPIIGVVYTFNNLNWFPSRLEKWIVDFLGPELRGSAHKDTLLFTYDDSRAFIPFWIKWLVNGNQAFLDYIDGFAIHWYTDFIIGPSVLTNLHNKYPDKKILYTESCTGFLPWEKKVDIGSWKRGEVYCTNIIQDLNNWVDGWIDWNLALDLNGGPNWNKNFVDAPILVNASAGEFYKQPMFYAVGHFSKFIERGAVRLDLSPPRLRGVHGTAALNPAGRLVVVLCNTKNKDVEVSINILGAGRINQILPKKSISTFLYDT